MKNMLTILGCCLLSVAAFASTNLPGKSALAGRKQSGCVMVAASPKVSHDAVLICHKGRAITVDAHAVPAHLAHGDNVGACGSTLPRNSDAK